MKLREIKFAIGYGKSRKTLVRSEGARRVKQAECLFKYYKRRTNPTKTFGLSKTRDQGRTETFRITYGDWKDAPVPTEYNDSAKYEGTTVGAIIVGEGGVQCIPKDGYKDIH
ncbi:hypothetical protein NVP1121O_067 [Vibrio phage 1.121.O._10N.286.46.C4]|nr:hypothetical protein NVP1121O_067 [Vibrio phage 1.121.O._10N.286.46.C4]